MTFLSAHLTIPAMRTTVATRPLRETALALLALDRGREVAHLVLPNPALQEALTINEISRIVYAASRYFLFPELNKFLANSKLSVFELCLAEPESALLLLSSTRITQHLSTHELAQICVKHATHTEFLMAFMSGATSDKKAFPHLKLILEKAKTTGDYAEIVRTIKKSPNLAKLYTELREAESRLIITESVAKFCSPTKIRAKFQVSTKGLKGELASQIELACKDSSTEAASAAIELMVCKRIKGLSIEQLVTLIYTHRRSVGPETIDFLLSLNDCSIYELILASPASALTLLGSSLVDYISADQLADAIVIHHRDVIFINALQEKMIGKKAISLITVLLSKAIRENKLSEIIAKLLREPSLKKLLLTELKYISPDMEALASPRRSVSTTAPDEEARRGAVTSPESTTSSSATLSHRSLSTDHSSRLFVPHGGYSAISVPLCEFKPTSKAENSSMTLQARTSRGAGAVAGAGAGAGAAEFETGDTRSVDDVASTTSAMAVDIIARLTALMAGHSRSRKLYPSAAELLKAHKSPPKRTLAKGFDPYATLGIDYDAGIDVIKKAHANLIKGFPRVLTVAQARQLELYEKAYKILTTPGQRAIWDQRLLKAENRHTFRR